jgi:hypothetical protein
MIGGYSTGSKYDSRKADPADVVQRYRRLLSQIPAQV